MKKVSIVLCTYNGELYLREQLDSLVSQSYPVYELIIQDDCSTDNTLNIVKEYIRSYPDVNIKVYSNTETLGYNRNFMSACQKTQGDFILPCDQDDIWKPHKVERLIAEMGDDCSLIFHNSLLFSGDKNMGKLHTKALPEYSPPIKALLMPQSYGHQMMFGKEVLPFLKKFQGLNLSYDYFIYTLCVSLGKIKYLDEALVCWRRHTTAATFSGRNISDNKIYGYIRAIRSLFIRSNRQTTEKYFKLCTEIDFKDKDLNRITRYMSRGTLWQVIRVSIICLRYRHSLAPETKGILQYVRSLFVPLFFIRDHGRYILKN
jgi:Glycosyltransferases involved in cell wall biogenesis